MDVFNRHKLSLLAATVMGLGAVGSAQAATLSCGPTAAPVKIQTTAASQWSTDAKKVAGGDASVFDNFTAAAWVDPATASPLKWLSYGVGNQVNPATSANYEAVNTNGVVANGAWVAGRATMIYNETITVDANVDLSTIKINGQTAFDDSGLFVVKAATLPGGVANTDWVRTTTIPGAWTALTTHTDRPVSGFYYGDNTVGFALFSQNSTIAAPAGVMADIEITADCQTPYADQPTEPLFCPAGTEAGTVVKIGPFTTNVRDWTWSERTNAAGDAREPNDQPLFGDYRFSGYVDPAALAGAPGSATAPTAARWISTGSVNPGVNDVPGVPYPEALGIWKVGYQGVVVKMNQPVTIGSNIDLASIELAGRFAFNQTGDQVWVQPAGQAAAEGDFNTLTNGYGALTTWTARTTKAGVATFAKGENSLGFVMNGFTNNTCPGGNCAMGALAEFYVQGKCTGEDPEPVVPEPVVLEQTITFTQPTTPRELSSGAFTVSATASSDLPVSYSSATPGVCTVDASTGVVTPVSVGICTIAADQAGGDEDEVTYNAAAQVTRSIVLQDTPPPPPPPPAKNPQTIDFPAQTSPVTVSEGSTFPIGPAATADSELPVSYTSLTPDVCTVEGSSVRVVDSGTCTIEASQPGNDDYLAAASVTQSVEITLAKRPQAIDFPAQTSPVTLPQGSTFPVGPAATSDSELPVSYTSLTPDVCTVEGDSVRVEGSGTCTIEASQPGDDDYLAAAPVTQSVQITVPVAAPAAIPTLNLAGLGLLSLLSAGMGAFSMRRRKQAK